MRTPESKLIGRYTYKVIPLNTSQALVAFDKVMKVYGPMFEGKDIPPEERSMSILRNMDHTEVKALCDIFAPCTQVNTEGSKWPTLSNIFDLHFIKHFNELFQWLSFCVQVNFEDFFVGTSGKEESASPDSEPQKA